MLDDHRVRFRAEAHRFAHHDLHECFLFAEDGHVRGGQRREPLAHAAALLDFRVARDRAPRALRDHLPEQRFLAVEVVVEGALGVAGADGDSVHARPLEPVPGEVLRTRLEQAAARLRPRLCANPRHRPWLSWVTSHPY